MAMYSIELRRYIDNFTIYERPQPPINKRIEVGQPHLFDFDYPFFDESKRKEFERKWIRRFYTVEVGFETFELFKFYLENWMNERMPYYNQRFKSELIEFDPMMNTTMDRKKDYSKDGKSNLDSKEDGQFETHTANDGESKSSTDANMSSDGTSDSNGSKTSEDSGSKTGNNKNVNDGTSFNRVLEEDTPDGRLDITTDDGKGIIRYASKITENTGKTHDDETISIDESTKRNALDNTNDKTTTHDEANTHSETKGETHDVGKATGTNGTTGNKNGTNNEIGNQNEHYVGKIGVETYSEMLEKYRSTFINIEREIYEECRRELFMLVL